MNQHNEAAELSKLEMTSINNQEAS